MMGIRAPRSAWALIAFVSTWTAAIARDDSSGDAEPKLELDALRIGGDAEMSLEGVPPEWHYAVLLDVAPGDLTLPGGARLQLGFTPAFQILSQGVVPHGGRVAWSLHVPDDPSLVGQTFHLQAVARSGQGFYRSSNAVSRRVEDPSRSPMGTNLASISYYDPSWVFTDAFRSSRPFHSDQGSLTLRDDGYPAHMSQDQTAWSIMYRDIDGDYPAGRYLCLYDGTGFIDFDLDATVVQRDAGRIVIDVAPTSQGIQLNLESTDANDPVHNIRLLLPGFHDDASRPTFHPRYLRSLEPYGVLRFMDWMETNDSLMTDWDDRVLPDYQTQGGDDGASIETAIDLANATGAAPWFCIPHLATDAYVRRLAELVEERLASRLDVYVEYSNETWNGGFDQADHCRDKGLELGLDPSPFSAQIKYHSQRSVEIFKLFRKVFDDPTRVVGVLGSQAANPWVTETILEWNDAYEDADAVAVAPYFGGFLGTDDYAPGTIQMSVDEILDACRDHIAGEVRTTRIRESVAAASQFGLPLLAYEGGQHLVGVGSWLTNPTLIDLFHQANRHPRMEQLYDQLLHEWSVAGGGKFAHYHHLGSFTQFGSWGSAESQLAPLSESPKARSVQRHSTRLRSR